jgi:hypothetical protein
MRGKVLLGAALLSMSVSLGMPSDGYAGAKEGPDLTTEELFGRIEGLLTAEFVEFNPPEDPPAGDVYLTFVGKCQKFDDPGTKISVAILATFFAERDAFEDMTRRGENGLRFFRHEDAPAGCFSAAGGENVIITKVERFIHAGVAFAAEVVVRGIRPIPTE